MTDITIINKGGVKKMKDSKKPGWKERLSNWTTAELMRLALFFQCIALVFQIAALILTIVRLAL